MIINRHNYEEVFLLYVDDELNDAEKAAVDNFASQNPDLAAELEMLMQTMLAHEDISFEAKHLLYKKENSISLDNYEEYFLLSTDCELTPKENEEVEKFVLKHPNLQDEYTLLSQTRLEPETIVFKHKEALYRKEAKERRILFFNWMRISAAAAVVALIAVTWLFTANTKLSKGNNTMAVTSKPVKTTVPKNEKFVRQSVTQQPVTALHKKAPVKVVLPKKANALNVEVVKSNTDFATNETRNKEVVTKPNNNLPKRETTIQEQTEPEVAVAKQDDNSNNIITKNNNAEATFASEKKVQPSTLVTHAVYKEIDTNEDEENNFYIGSAEINKKKLKGLFKKATSLFEKKNNKKDGEKTLQIAGFEIKSQ